MSTFLNIANISLCELGLREIATLTQGGRAADRCAEHVEAAVKEVLCAHAWSHATVWDTLAVLETAPPFGYSYAYQAPTECYRVIDVRSESDLKAPRINFEQVRGKKIYTDASPCYVRYVVHAEADLLLASPEFCLACAYKLAARLCVPLSKSDDQGKMKSLYREALDVAKLGDTATMNERQQDPNRTCSILAARDYPGVVSDAEDA